MAGQAARKRRAVENAQRDARQAFLRATRSRARVGQLNLANADQAVLLDEAWELLDRAIPALLRASAALEMALKQGESGGR